MYLDLSVDLQSLWKLFRVTVYYPFLQFLINYPVAATAWVSPAGLKVQNDMHMGTCSCLERRPWIISLLSSLQHSQAFDCVSPLKQAEWQTPVTTRLNSTCCDDGIVFSVTASGGFSQVHLLKCFSFCNRRVSTVLGLHINMKRSTIGRSCINNFQAHRDGAPSL